ncbi:MAG: DUF1501 domain-containing protein [Phycisphaerales bacterium]|nr:DUF1501 domain-containing protein [Phycisphaerales bacterium]
MMSTNEAQLGINRRHFFSGCAGGVAGALGGMALTSLLAREATASPRGEPAKRLPHFPPRAKRVIYLCLADGPSQIDLFDYKPKLVDHFDKDLPESIRQGQRITTMTSGQARFPVAPSKFAFRQHGKNGTWLSELLPNIGSMVDDIAIVRSMNTNAINHDPALTFLMSGHELPGRPSLGSWLSYGLGSANAELPAFVVLHSTWSSGTGSQALFSRLWGTGFLPSEYQGVALRSSGDPVLYLGDPPGVDGLMRRQLLDRLANLNRIQHAAIGDPETVARIQQYEMAYRMQASVPELIGRGDETAETYELYGPDAKTPGTFASNCLLARRLAERDVRFVQVYHRGWDHHGDLAPNLPKQCADVDRACYALVTDLKRRGMLDDTLVVCGGEFGRTAYCQGPLTKENYGRDHHPRCFTMWLAGGGVRGGVVHGETDDFSYNVVDAPVHVHDLNATILHLMGFNHEKLTHRYQGRDFRLTDVHGNVVHDILL